MNFSYHYKSYAESLYHALTEDAFYIRMEASVVHDHSPREAMMRYMDYSMQEAAAYGELYLPNGHDYGASVWSKPISAALQVEKDRLKETFLLAEMGKRSLKTYRAIVDSMSSLSGSVVDESYWYLSIVGLHPSRQGQGLGRTLIAEVLCEADACGVDTYLETYTPRNMSFYKRFGYEAIADFHEPVTDARYWVMVRKRQD